LKHRRLRSMRDKFVRSSITQNTILDFKK